MKIKGQVDTRLVINNLRHGLHNLPASGMRISLVALLGAAGAILILKDAIARNFKIVPCSTSQDNLLVVPGLQNLGNNCFLNVILQVIIFFSLDCFFYVVMDFVLLCILCCLIVFRLWQAVLVFGALFEREWRSTKAFLLRNWKRLCRLLFRWILCWKVLYVVRFVVFF